MSRGKILIVSLCAALVLAVAGCGSSSDDSSSTQSASTEAKGGGATDLNEKPKVTVPSGAAPKKLEEKEIVEGSGAEAKAGDKVTVQYVGVGYDSKEEFDSSWSRNEPFSFTLGGGEVITGWDKGVAGMKVGGRRELIIPPGMAYGPAGSPPVIGPNETLIFVIDLLAVH
ncbi:MAG TPA: FKBP-type peptidyl-prolyl cis-trans isomerase [Solirubrobacterales bacterium]